MSLQAETNLIFPTRTHDYVDWDYLKSLQNRRLVVGCPKTVAADSGLHTETIYRAMKGYPVTLFTALRLSQAQKDFSYIALLLEHCGMLLTALRRVQYDKRTAVTLMEGVGTLLQFCSKLEDETVLTDEQMRQLEQVGQEVKDTIDAIVNCARERRGETSETS